MKYTTIEHGDVFKEGNRISFVIDNNLFMRLGFLLINDSISWPWPVGILRERNISMNSKCPSLEYVIIGDVYKHKHES